jgi:hypothetical protein
VPITDPPAFVDASVEVPQTEFPQTVEVRTATNGPARVYVPAEGVRAVQEELDRANAALQLARQDASTVRASLERFRQSVRETAIQVAAEQGWCRQGLNDTLRDLGLDPVPTEFRVKLRVPAWQTIEATVEIDDLDTEDQNEAGAEAYVTRNAGEYVDGGAWEIAADEIEVDTVEGVTD